jgi:HlyD family secretion protein
MIKLAGKSRWIVSGVVLVLAGTGLLLLTLRPPPAQALQMQAGPLVRTLQFSARVATLSRVDIGSTLTGRVAQVRVREGAQVRRGDVLITLETDELKAAVAQAVAAQSQADATLQVARATLTRAQQLVAQNFYSAAQLDEARRALDVALAQQASARAAIVAARARLEQAAILAPTAARVLSRQVEPGQIVQPGRALMSLALAGPTQITAQVDERFLDQLQVGQKAMVVADAFADQRFAAHVLSIAPVIDPQRGAIEVKFALEETPPAFLREDMTLSVEVETGRRERALVLPLTALLGTASGAPANPQASVLVVQNGRVQERSVRLGLRTLDAVEILEGLAAGDVVLLQRTLQVGKRVRTQLVSWQPGAAGPGSRAEDAGAAVMNAMGR